MGTRLVYPLDAHQESVSIRNTSSTDSFLVQSWVENAEGNKSQDFVVTPPLYLSGPNNENSLRLMKMSGPNIQDREQLYYFIAKAIPSMAKDTAAGESTIRIAAASRIKLFVRPAGLTPAPDKAPGEIRFRRASGKLEINNPTPYYITLTNLWAGEKPLEGVMVAPKSSLSVSLPSATASTITYSTINDYGALSKPITVRLSR